MATAKEQTEKLEKRLKNVPIEGTAYEGKCCYIYLNANDVYRILQACIEAGLKFVDMDSLRIIQAESASQRDGYWADGIGGTWERDAPIFELFYKANFRRFEELEL